MATAEKVSFRPTGLASTKSRDLLAFPSTLKSAPALACTFSVFIHLVLALGVSWLSKNLATPPSRDPMASTFELDVFEASTSEAAAAAPPSAEAAQEPKLAPPPRVRPSREVTAPEASIVEDTQPTEDPQPAEAQTLTATATTDTTASTQAPTAQPTALAAVFPGSSAHTSGTSLDTRSTARFESSGTGAHNRSRPPMLAGGARWDCAFPREADEARIDQAVVTLRVEIGSTGAVQSVAVARDPGEGFGREARRCAFRKQWTPGLDRAGRPTASASLVNVRFQR